MPTVPPLSGEEQSISVLMNGLLVVTLCYLLLRLNNSRDFLDVIEKLSLYYDKFYIEIGISKPSALTCIINFRYA